jgi:hypothetical protein
MTQPGETDGYDVKEHINALHRQAGQSFVDYGSECFSLYFCKTLSLN